VTLTSDSGTDTYIFNTRWNSRDAAWYIDIYENDYTPIALGVKLVLGLQLGRAMKYRKFFQEHVLQVIDTANTQTDAGYDDLGDRVVVMHMSMTEFKGG
jgi:hypothetical protein